MKKSSRASPLLLPILLMISSANAESNSDFCQLIEHKQAAKRVLTTFAIVGGFPHGFSATSASCPTVRIDLNYRTLGEGKRASAFYSWLVAAPKRESGVVEVQATVDFTGSELTINRLHSYRELPESSSALFFEPPSPAEEDEARKAASDADKAAPKDRR